MEIPSHWTILERFLGDERWFADLKVRLRAGGGPETFLERQLMSSDYGPAVASWLDWAESRGGSDRVRVVLRDRRSRADREVTGAQYRWRQVLDEFQVAHAIDRQTRLSINSTEEPPGRGATKLDWSAESDSGQRVVIEVKSIFTDVFPWDDDEIHRLEPSGCIDGPFKKAAAKFSDDARNVVAIVTHEPWPDANAMFHFLFGPEVTTYQIGDRGQHLGAHVHLDPSPRGRASDRPDSMYAHFNPRRYTRVGAVLFAHSQPDGTARIVVFHNPWARCGCECRLSGSTRRAKCPPR